MIYISVPNDFYIVLIDYRSKTAFISPNRNSAHTSTFPLSCLDYFFSENLIEHTEPIPVLTKQTALVIVKGSKVNQTNHFRLYPLIFGLRGNYSVGQIEFEIITKLSV